MEFREFGNIGVEFYYDGRKENPYVVKYTWNVVGAEQIVCNYSPAVFDRIIREELNETSELRENAKFEVKYYGMFLKYVSGFSDMKSLTAFDADYGLNGTLVEFVKKELKGYIDSLKKQTDELEKGLEEC